MTTLTAYRVAPQMEFKAQRELNDHGIKAYVPRERDAKRKTPVARGYVFAAYKPAFAKHCKSAVGTCTAAEIVRLYPKRQKRAAELLNPFQAGQTAFRGEVQVKVEDVRGRSCIISFDLLGTRQTQAIHYSQLRPG